MTSSTPFDPSPFLEKWKAQFELSLLQWIQVPAPNSHGHYLRWIAQDFHGDMTYLKDHAAQKSSFCAILPSAKSILTVGVRYNPHPHPDQDVPHLPSKIAAYAQGSDYHVWLKDRLQTLLNEILSATPVFQYEIATDSKPILERDLAAQAGLGWIGKNTCLIHPQEGSFFFLAEVLTTLEITLTPPSSVPDFCGNCRRCLEACPTQALIAPRVLDSRKCISYLTIEAKSIPPLDLRDKIGEWLFGCDVCQDVCPWNEKFFRKNPSVEFLEKESSLEDFLLFLLTSSNRELELKLNNSPLIRARPRGLRRNAIIVAANSNFQGAKTAIERFQEDPQLGELARWALQKLKTTGV